MPRPARTGRRARSRALFAVLAAVAVTAGMLTLPDPAPAEASPPPGRGTIVVTVTDASTGAPVSGVSTGITPVTIPWDWHFPRAVSGRDGVVSFDVPPGNYFVEGQATAEHVATFYPAAFFPEDADLVRVAMGQTLRLELPMQQDAEAEFTVTAGGQPVESSRVLLTRVDAHGTIQRECPTDARGVCAITGLIPGAYSATASAGWKYQDEWMPGSWPGDGATVTIASGERARGTVALPRATRVTGVVQLDFEHSAWEVASWVSANYTEEWAEAGPGVYRYAAPGGSVEFELNVEAGRPFRLALTGFEGSIVDERRIVATEEWTADGMAQLGDVITVAEGETPHFELTAHLGVAFAGTYRVEDPSGVAAGAAAAVAPLSDRTQRVAPRVQQAAVAGADQAADMACLGSCGLVAIDLFQERANGWRYFDTLYGAPEEETGVDHEFAFTGLAPGTYRVGFWGDSTCSEMWEDSRSFEGARSFEVPAAGGSPLIDAQLQVFDGVCAPPRPEQLPAPERLSGDDRFATSVAISQRSFPGTASVVYLASGMNYPDGLAAGPAAAREGGPVLLTPPDGVPRSVLSEIERLQPAKIVIVGGTPSVWAQAEAQVRALDPGRQVVRLGGADRFETSRLIADHAFGDGTEAAFLATGMKFPDALTAGPAAALLGGPVLLVNGAEATPDAGTRATLDALGVWWVGVTGDAQSVSLGFEHGLVTDGFAVERFSGPDRFATAAEIGTIFEGASTVLVASGEGFADALPGAAAAGTIGAPMLLSRSSCVPTSTATALDRWMPDDVWLLGGRPTLGAPVESYTACR